MSRHNPKQKLLRNFFQAKTADDIEMLHNGSANIEELNESGQTPYEYFCERGNIEVVMRLLDFNCSIFSPIGNLSGFEIACSKNHIELVDQLVNYDRTRIQINDTTHNTISIPLIVALKYGNTQIVKLLLENTADPNLRYKEWPLIIAVQSGNIENVQLLISHGVHLYVTDKKNNNVLAIATSYGYTNIVKLLLVNGLQPDTPNKYHKSAIHIARDLGYETILQILLSFIAGITYVSKNIGTLSSYFEARTENDVRLLYRKGFPINKKNNKGYTPYQAHCIVGNIEVVLTLISLNCKIDEPRYDERGLDLACKYGNIELVRAILLIPKISEQLNEQGRQKVYYQYVIGNNDIELMQLLLENGMNSNLPDNNGRLPLFYAVHASNFGMTKLLLEFGADLHRSPFLITAAARHNLPIMELLLSYGADVNIRDYTGKTSLHYGIGNTKIAEFLLKNGANPNIEDNDRHSPLIYAFKYIDTTLLRLMLDYKANPNVQDRNGTLLNTAVANRRNDLIDVLLEYGASPDISAKPPLYEAVYKNYLEIIGKLLAAGADVNNTGIYSRTVLFFCKSDSAVNMLYNYGINLNHRDRDGDTALNCFSSVSEKLPIVALCNLGPDINLPNKTGKTPLISAAINRNYDKMKVLIDYGADVHITDQNNNTALDYVRRYDTDGPEQQEIVDSLIAAGAV